VSGAVAANTARAFAPAAVGNVAVGFDILGHSLAGAGDTATVRRVDAPGVRIVAVRGVETRIPLEADRNTAGVALLSLARILRLPFGFEVELDKGIALGSGMGGSASSCVAALVAANSLLDAPLPHKALYSYALDGESIASGSRNGDNVAPMLLGGLVLATAQRMVPIPVPPDWHCLLVHPEQVLETLRAREVLRDGFALPEIVAQNANLGLVLAGCFRGDAALVRAGLRDVLVQPRRAPLIAGFEAVQAAALAAGAMGAGISGAGPSVFAWFESQAAAEAAAAPMRAAFAAAGMDSEAFVSPVAGPAATLLPA
jgi:homoserine kinase